MNSERLARSQRISRRKDILQVLGSGRRVHRSGLTLFFLPGQRWRFAVLVGKKLGSAPLRNRHKRWAREAFRRQRADFPLPGSLIVRFTQPALHYEHVRRALTEAYHLAIQDRHRSD